MASGEAILPFGLCGEGDPPAADSDLEMLRKTSDGDSLAFESLVGKYQNRLYGFALKHLGDTEAARDTVQEVFLKLYQAAPGFEPRGKLSSWLFTVTWRLCCNELKRRSRWSVLKNRIAAENMVESRAAATGRDGAGMEGEIARAIQGIPDQQRAALLLRVNEELSYAEIADVLGVSTASVESLLFRARSRLRKQLGRERE